MLIKKQQHYDSIVYVYVGFYITLLHKTSIDIKFNLKQ